MAWRVEWRVTINGSDVTTNMRPFLTEITISDKDGTASDTCALTFDDAGGQCLLPKVGAKVTVHLDGALVFEGVVDSTPWTLTRGGGRMLQVNAKGFDTRGKAKEGQRWHLDDATLKDALERAGKQAGLSGVVVDPSFASIQRSYWSPDGASFLAWGDKLARQHGATFKIRGDKAVFAKRGSGASAAGGAMPTVEARIPGNVISANVDPVRGRRRFAKARVRSFDRASASYKETDVEIEDLVGGLDVVNERRDTVADEDEAKLTGEGRKSDAEREGGSGTVEINIEPSAQAEGTFVLTGARPGVDGTYRIVSVTHKATRSGGATTSLEIKQPGQGTGKDTRTAADSLPQPANVPIPTPAPR